MFLLFLHMFYEDSFFWSWSLHHWAWFCIRSILNLSGQVGHLIRRLHFSSCWHLLYADTNFLRQNAQLCSSFVRLDSMSKIVYNQTYHQYCISVQKKTYFSRPWIYWCKDQRISIIIQLQIPTHLANCFTCQCRTSFFLVTIKGRVIIKFTMAACTYILRFSPVYWLMINLWLFICKDLIAKCTWVYFPCIWTVLILMFL